MYLTLVLYAFLGAAVASPSFHLEPLSEAQIFYINNVIKPSWKAGRNFEPSELERVKGMLGVDLRRNKEVNSRHLKIKEVEVKNDLPKTFDPRTKWPQCPSLSEIRDQSACGSCWAFAAVEAISDRICIKGGGNVYISAEDVNNCCPYCGMGCNGGYPIMAWQWYTDAGVVTGGPHNSSQGCQPYSFPKCDHHVKGKYGPCPKELYPTPKCVEQCIKGYGKSYEADKEKGNEVYGVRGVDQIAQDLVDKGSVTASFMVYEDFLSYKSGVYRHVTGAELNGHAIKIIGYGVEDRQDYWLAVNSWNEGWGDEGYFKIAKGNNECGIEDSIVTGDPRV